MSKYRQKIYIKEIFEGYDFFMWMFFEFKSNL